MCGIAGIFHIHPANHPADRDLLTAMGAALAHRGPDDAGVYTDGPIGLAHTRLSIIDLAGGHQPLFSQDGRIALVANGEIYNHIELRTQLEAGGHRFTTHSDSEVIIYAYLEYGMDFLSHLSGMFAFALYDKQQQRLLLARDRLGIKPLFFAEDASRVAFASEIKGLLPAFARTPEIHPPALAEFLQSQFNNGRETIFSGIHRLLPGEAMCVEPGSIRRWRYWSAAEIMPVDIGFEEACVQFDSLMETVMRQHMRTDVPFGLFLSGGVDSSILLGLLSRFSAEPIRTFSVSFPEAPNSSELTTGQALASHYASRHTLLQPRSEEMLTRLIHSVWAADDLMRDFANMPTMLLAEQARREVKVVFSGEGGDEVFAGYGRYRVHGLARKLKSLLFPGSGGFRTRGNFSPALLKRVFNPALQRAAGYWRTPFIQAWREAPLSWSEMQRMQYIDLTTALPDNLLVKLDRMLMAHSVEGRVPFLDHRIVEFGFALPDRLKVEGRQGKAFLRRWAERFIPADFHARKTGFHVPVGHWLQGEYLDRLGQVLLKSPGIQHWFHPAGVMKLIELQKRQRNVAKNLTALLQFAIWHRLFVEGNGTLPPQQDPLEFLGGRG